ncbi:MAG: hypothetical protein B0D91_00790 [Oceanospirillales bacterium LUC14_002_19_P2]|nr:MAG: hypothetical protein B0D91_00790 [Oceanospirillales bacterium LUC14_002_19_P2]
MTGTEPKVALPCLKKTIDCMVKSLLDFVITVFNITFTFMLSFVLVPAGAIYGLRLVAEFAYNRYLHYEKHHVGELAQERKSLYKTQKQKEHAIKQLLEDHIQKLQALQNSQNITASQDSETSDSNTHDSTWGQINNAYRAHSTQFTIANNLRDNVTNAKTQINDLKENTNTYNEKSATAFVNFANALDDCYQSVSQTTLSNRRIERCINDAQSILALVNANLTNLDSTMESRICQACCPTCNSCIAESLPSSIRAGLITLVALPYLIPVGMIMGAVNTVRMVTKVTWITCPSKAKENETIEAPHVQEAQSQFPWRSPFPFGDGQGINQCCPC